MVKNEMIKTDVQKGFLTRTAGCVEHTFAFNEALRVHMKTLDSLSRSGLTLKTPMEA